MLRLRRTAIFALFTAVARLVTPSPAAASQTYYVAPDGDDRWSGTRAARVVGRADGPFATLERARDAIRELRRNGDSSAVIVYLRGGTYYLEGPVVFTPEDSGSFDAPVIYEAYPGETPVLSGGRSLGQLQERVAGLGQMTIPEVTDGWFFAQLFVNGRRAVRARIPNDGFLRMHGAPHRLDPVQFSYRDGDINPDWAGRGVEVNAIEKWAVIRMPISSVDPDSRIVSLKATSPPYNWGGARDARYWIENAPEGLDMPGEWTLDPASGVLRYMPRPGECVGGIDLIAPRLDRLIVIEGRPWADDTVDHITFRGITFSHTAGYRIAEGYGELQAAHQVPAAFHADGARHIHLEGNRFVSLGGYAVEFARGVKDSSIVGSHMTDLGAGGVKVGEPSLRRGERDRTERISVTDNHIHDIGVLYPAAVGILVLQSGENLVAHNLIHDTYYTAISVGWTWGYGPTSAHRNVVEQNHAWNIGRGLLSDMGAVYTLGPQEGTVIRNNVFRDVRSYDYGGWGLYTDEGSTGIVMEHNIVYRCKSAAFHQHFGRDNVIRNNVLALGEEYQLMRTRAEGHLSFILESNIVYYEGAALLGSNWTGPSFLTDRNLFWRTDGEVSFNGMTLPAWQLLGHDTRSIVADPRFVDPRSGDFRLQPDSPAGLIGFEPIDVSNVGPRDPWRTPLSVRSNRIQ